MRNFRTHPAVADRRLRRVALVTAALALAVAAASAGGAAAPAADENASGSDGEPRVVDASVHDVDDGQHVLVVVLETDDGTDTVVTELDDGADAPENAPAVDEGPEPKGFDLPTASDGSVDLSNASGERLALSNASGGAVATEGVQIGTVGANGAGSGAPNGSTAGPAPPGSTDGAFLEEPVVDVPDALRSPPERLSRAISSEPAFGGGWLLPGALAALGGAMATLGVGALGIWRRTI